MTTAEKVCQLIADQAYVEAVIVEPDTRLDSLPLDSLDIVEISIHAEEEFGMATVPGKVVMGWKTVADVIQYIESKTQV